MDSIHHTRHIHQCDVVLAVAGHLGGQIRSGRATEQRLSVSIF